MKWFTLFLCVHILVGGCSSQDSKVPEDVSQGDSARSLDGSMDSGDLPDAQTPPVGLPFEFLRPDDGEPLSKQELTEFSEDLGHFLHEKDYFGFLLRSSHGVDASTGKPSYAIWCSDVEAVKQGDVVTFRHKVLDQGGGHNIITSHSAILATAIAAALSQEDPEATELATLYCQGITATMKGMVHDADDPIEHIMARNIVTFNHQYTTRDGGKKAVDYSGWYSPYSRWNCQRFQYLDNPFWGSVWVTNVRSKDDVGNLLRAAALIQIAAEQATDEGLVSACGETLTYLQDFTADIVDNGYFIRTKDDQGVPFIFSQWEKPEGMRQSDDLDNFVTFDPLFPDAECNEKRACDWIGKGDGTLHDCGDGGANIWERVSLENNYPNINFFRAYHLANLYQSLLHEDFDSAKQLLAGLVTRFEEDMTYDFSHISVPPDRWHADLAFALVRAASQGYPLTSKEVRLIHKYTRRALERLADWPRWDLWSAEIEDGTYDYKPPRSASLEDGTKEYWTGIEELGALIEYCWSPWKNPAGQPPVDCEAMEWSSTRNQ